MPRTLSLTALQIAALSSANDTILYNAQAQSISLYGGTDLASTITELEINNQTGDCLKLRYNGDTNKYANIGLDSSGNLNLNVNGGDKSFNIVNHNGSTMGLKLGGTLVIATAAEINSLSGVSASFSLLNYLDSTPGTATASKALITDANNNISGINDLSTQNLTVNGTLVTASATELNYTDIATAGTAQASKALVVDNSRNITNIHNLTATNLTGTLQTASQPNITSVGTLNDLTVTNGIITSSIDATSVLVGGTDITSSLNSVAAVSGVTDGTVSASKALIVDSSKNLTGMGNLTSTGTISASTLTGQLSTAAQPNITSVGTLTSLALSGNISGAGTVSATNLTGTLTTASQPNVTSVGTLNGLTASGNVDISSHNGTTSGLKLNGTLVTAQASDINKLTSITATTSQLNYVSGVTAGVVAAGSAVVVDNNKDSSGMRNITITGSISGASSITATNLTGTLQTASQPNITSVGTLGDLTVTNDITADTVNANTFLLNGSDLTSSLGNVAAVDGVTAGTVTASKALIVDSNKNLTGMGDLTSTGTIAATTLAGELSTASQPNVTSVGTLNGLTASGNVNVSSHNGTTTGLTLNGTLVTAQASDLNKLTGVTAGTVSASKAVIVDGSSNLTGINNLTVTGDVSGVGTLSATNLTGALTTASQPNVTSVGTLTSLISNGNVNVAQHNGSTTGLTLNGTLVTAQASDLNKLTGVTAGTVSASKAVIVDGSSNLTGINNLTVTGNVSGVNSLSATTLTGTIGSGSAAQTNITSVGTLTGLTVNNNLDIAQHDGSSAGLKLNGVLVTAQASDLNKLPNITATATQINTLTGVTAGTVSAGKAVVVDSNNDVTGLHNVTVTGDISGVGTLSATTLTGTLSAGAQNNITTLTGATSVGQNGSTVLTGTLATASQPNITTLGGVTSIGQNSSTTLTGTLQTAAQPQITSVGTLSSLTLGGALSGITTLGSSGQITNTDSTASTSNISGAVQLSGGIGINNTTDASSSTNGGTLTSAGGGAFAKSVYVGTNLNVGNNLTVGGNLTVSGTTTTINSTTTNILDNTIVLNSGPSVTGKDAGMITQRYQVDNILGTGDVVNDTANESYAVVSSTTTTIVLPSGASTVDNYYTNWWIKVTSGSRINSVRKVTNYVGSTKTLTLDAALAGALTASDNISLYNKSYTAFVWNETNKRYATLFTTSDTDLTNLSASNYADFASGKIVGFSSTSTTSASTGAVQLSGGIGINNTTDASSSTNGGTLTSAGGGAFAKSLYVGTNLNIGGNSTLTGTLSVSGSSTLAGLSSSANVVVSGGSSILTIVNTTASTSSSTGALQVAGGAYFGANSIVSGTLTTSGLSSSANVSVSGASSTLTIANTTASTSGSTGALQVAGGSYFGANSIMNANLSVNGSLIVNSTTVSGTDLAKLTSVLNGTASASKALVLDSSSNISGIASLSATTLTGTLQTGPQPNITTLLGVTSVGANSSTVLTGTLAAGAQNNVTTLTGATSVGQNGSTVLTGTLATALQPNVTTLAGLISFGASTVTTNMLGNLSVAGTLAGTLTAGAQNNITTLTGATSVGQNSSTVLTGTLATAAQPNITSVGTLSSLTLGGAISGVTTLTATTLAGTLSTASQPNVTTLAGVTSIGASSSTTLTGTLQTASQPNITTLAGVTSVGASGSTTLTGTLQTAAQPNITSVGTLSSLTLGGAISGVTTLTATTLAGTLSTASQPNITTLAGVTSIGASDATTLTGILQTTAQPNITTLAGVTSIGASGSTTLTGTLQTAAQPNITSVGTLSSLTLGGALSGVTTLGTSGNVTIAGGTSGGILSIANTTASTSASTGALQVAGGAGFGGNTYIGGNLNVTGTISGTLASLNLSSVAVLGLNGSLSNTTLSNWSTNAAVAKNYTSGCWSPELGLFAIINSASTSNIYTSPDGTTWTARTLSTTFTALTGICWSPDLGLFIAVGTGASNTHFTTSSDGITWTSGTVPAVPGLTSVCWSSDLKRLIATSTNGYMLYSSNAQSFASNSANWSSAGLINSGNVTFSSIIWCRELVLFVVTNAFTGANTTGIYTSPDGITWTARTTPSVTGGLSSVAWSRELNMLVAVSSGSSNNSIMYSTNATSWTMVSSLPTMVGGYRSVSWIPETGSYIAVGGSTATNGQNYSISYNGTTWSSSSYTSTYADVRSCIVWSPDLSLMLFPSTNASSSYPVITTTQTANSTLNVVSNTINSVSSKLGMTAASQLVTSSGLNGTFKWVNATTTTQTNELMRLSKEGYLGINTETPQRLLHLTAPSSTNINIIRLSNPGNNFTDIGVGTNGNLVFNTSGASGSHLGVTAYPNLLYMSNSGLLRVGATANPTMYNSSNFLEVAAGAANLSAYFAGRCVFGDSANNYNVTINPNVALGTTAYQLDFGNSGGTPNTMAINLYAGTRGFGASASALNYMSDGSHKWYYQSSSITGSTTAQPSGSNTMTLDTSGNLTIGGKIGLLGTNPSYPIDLGTTSAQNMSLNLYNGIYGLGACNNSLQYFSSGANGHKWYTVSSAVTGTGSAPGTNLMTLLSSGSLMLPIYTANQCNIFGNWDNGAYWGITSVFSAIMPNSIAFRRCDSAGTVTNTTPAYVNIFANGLRCMGTYGDGTSYSYGYFNAAGQSGTSSSTATYSIYATGRCLALEFDATSDRRIKKNITQLTNQYCKDFIKKTVPMTYNFKSQGDNAQLQFGYIAQDLIKAGFVDLVNLNKSDDPNAIEITDDDGFVNPAGAIFNVSYQQITPILAKNIEMMYAENEVLTTRVTELETKNSDLESRLARLEAFIATLEITE